MKLILTLSRIFIGLVFVFSGFVKAIDPQGSAIKFEEYFVAFHLDFLFATALPLAILLSSAEMMIGLNLLVRLRVKFTGWLLIIFMTFFTVLTFILALSNPVSDCGCFGDALKLTNWQTFWKNIILLVPALIIFKYRKIYAPLSSAFTEWYLASVNFILPVMVSVFCLLHQPVLDFRPYKTGTNIPESMVLPEGAAVDQYETILVYEKNGVRQEFSESNYPWQDSTWKWVETQQKLISKGAEPPIHDFSITSAEGEDLTDRVLSDSRTVLLIIAPKLERASLKGMQRMNELAIKARNLDLPVYCLTSSASTEIERFRSSFQPAFELCTADETTLKTIIRANPGLLILNKGTVLGKWNFRDAPFPEDLENNMLPFLLIQYNKSIEVLSVVLITLVIIIFYLTFHRTFIMRERQIHRKN